jgi:predicted lipid-binding transport protein (Tim44 family)
MVRVTVIAALVLAGPATITIPASAAAAQTEAQAQGQGKCDDNPRKKAKRSLFGGVLGGIAGGILGGSDLGGMASLIPVGSIVADELLKLLDCKEQKQAANATNEAIRGGVGTEVRWQSETRQNVSGVSKVTGQQQLADGTNCMTVTDVVIIDGEETTVPKRMCRGAGDSGYRKA